MYIKLHTRLLIYVQIIAKKSGHLKISRRNAVTGTNI